MKEHTVQQRQPESTYTKRRVTYFNSNCGTLDSRTPLHILLPAARIHKSMCVQTRLTNVFHVYSPNLWGGVWQVSSLTFI